MAEKPQKVRYRVIAPCFVNGSYFEPVKGADVFVDAAPGLEGHALKPFGREADVAKAPLSREPKQATQS